MTELYDPDAFAALTESAWDEAIVREAIRDIVADADAAYGDGPLWPADEWDAWQTPTPLKALYVGAAGVVWALDALRRRGHAETRLDLAAAARSTLERWSSEPDLMRGVELPEPARAGLLSGQAGILAVSYRVDPSDEVADELFERARENVRSTATGVMWGSPGTLLAARAMLDWTGEERWAEVWRDSATALLAARDADGLWEQWLYGERFLGLIPLYGLVGNVLALLGGSDLLGENTLAPEAAAVLRRTAMHDEGLANWPSSAGERPRQDDASPRLQWCVGAPGIVVCAAPYLDEDLLLAAAKTIWRAGPHGDEKGAGLCHGTAGNGYALLKTFERTGDERWLERARSFAVHALEQVARLRATRGRGRYSLWTGDLGVALYIADCLEAQARYPILETW